MEVSPKTLREVEFREKMRGYHPEDVDQFLEQVAAGIEVLQDRLRQAVERAQRAEVAASESGGADETLRKTLVLAQRTADMAVQEAREQASRILGSAEQQAQSILAEAEERGRRTLEDTIADCKAELSRLESNRSQAQQDVESLQRWLDEHKEHLRVTLSEALSAVDRAGVLWPAPTTRPVDTGTRRAGPATPTAAAEPANGHSPGQGSGHGSGPGPGPDGPDTMMWAPDDQDGPAGSIGASTAASVPAAVSAGAAGAAGSADPAAATEPADSGPDEQALDDFFDDNTDFDDDRRFGGRLRRRR